MNRVTRWLLAMVCLVLIGLPAHVMALDKDQIVQMSEMGLADSAIMGAIDSAGTDLQLDDDDVENLRDQGVSDAVISHLRRRGHVVGDAVADDDDFDDDDLDAIAPAPAPAPADGEETEEERLERERLEQERDEEIRRRAEELRQQEEEEERRRAEMTRAAREMDRADDLVDRGQNMEAARIYLEFLNYEPEHDSDEWYQATFGLAKALFQQGIYSGATTPLIDILMQGSQRPHFQEAFMMLTELTRRINYQPPILETLTGFYLGDFNPRFREIFNYYMGKFFYDYGRMERALEYFDEIPNSAPEYPESRYLAGVAQLAPEVNDIPAALRNFEDAILAAERADHEAGEDILQLGYLALARVFFEVGFFDVALYYYQQIPSESARHADAMFESAWSYFMKNDFERALGAFHSLHSPYYAGRYYPELYILEATAYLNMCNFDKSHRALREFREQYLNQRPALREYLDETIEPEQFWTMMEEAYKPGANHEVPRLFTNAVLENLAFYNIFQVVRALQAERDALMANIDTLGDFGEEVLERVEEQLEMNIVEGGIIVQQHLTDVDRELQDWERSALQIEFDIENEEREELRRQMQNPGYEPPELQEAGTTLMVVADDWQSWPFEGEYWLDEVDSYRSQMRTECIEP